MKQLRTLAFLLSFASLVSACGTKSSPVRPNESARAAMERTGDEAAPLASDLSKNELDSLEAKLGSSGRDDAMKIVKTVSPALFESGLLDEPSRYQTAYARRLLTIFNRAAFAVTRSDLEFANAKEGPMAQWEASLLAGCDETLKGCRLINFFRTDSKSADMALIRSRARSALKEKYRLMRVAFDLSGSQRPEGLEREYTAHAPQFLIELRKEGAEKFVEDIRRLENMIETVLLKSAPAERAHVLATINAIAPVWNYSAHTEPATGRKLAEIMFRFAADSAIYQGKGLDPALVQVLKERAAKDDSVQKDIERMRAKAGARLDVIGLPTSVPLDEYFYVVSSVFEGHLSPDEAALVWNGTQRDRAQLIARARDYVRVRVLALLQESNVHLKQFLAQKNVFSSGTLLTKALEEAFVLTNRWDKLFERVEILRTFTQKSLFDSRIVDPAAEELFQDFRGLRRNVKYFAVWPTMFMLSYHLSKADFKVTFDTFFGPITIDTGLLLSEIAEGFVSAWLNFGNDDAPINQVEVAYALSYAAATGVFEDYGITQQEFFAEFLRRYLSFTDTEVRQSYQNLVNDVIRDPHFRQFNELCQTEEQTRPHQIRLEDFEKYTYHGSGQPKNSTPALYSVQKIFGTGIRGVNAPIQQIEQVTLVLEPRLRRARGFLEIFKSHTKDAAAIRALENEIEKYEQSKRHFMGEYIRVMRSTAVCHQKMLKREYERQNRLLLAEAEYLREIHRRLTVLRSLPEGSRARAEEQLNAELRIVPSYIDGTQLPSLSHYSEDGIRLNRLDAFLRMASFLERGWPAAKIPAIGPQTRMLLPANPYDPSLNFATRSVSLAYLDNQEEFVQQGLKFWISGAMKFVDWRIDTRNISLISNRWAVMAALYKTGGHEVYDTSVKDESGRPKIKIEKITAGELLDEVLRTADLIQLTETEIKVSRLLGQSGRFDRADITGLLLPNDASTRHALGDMFTEFIVAKINGFQNEGVDEETNRPVFKKVHVLSWGQWFYKDQIAVGRLYLPLPEGTESAVQEIYRSPVQGQIRAMKELVEEAAKRSKSGHNQIRYHMRNDAIGMPEGLISRTAAENLISQIQELNKETKNFFVEKPQKPVAKP